MAVVSVCITSPRCLLFVSVYNQSSDSRLLTAWLYEGDALLLITVGLISVLLIRQ